MFLDFTFYNRIIQCGAIIRPGQKEEVSRSSVTYMVAETTNQILVERQAYIPMAKQKLLYLRREANITSQKLASVAGVPLHMEYLMEIGGLVDSQTAKQVLEAFSNLVGKTYTLENVEVNLRPLEQSSTIRKV